MTLPGVTFRVIASRLCSAQTMERVIDPLIADLTLTELSGQIDSYRRSSMGSQA